MENTNEMLSLTESEMLNLWKNLFQLQPTRTDCTLERIDGIDLDEFLLLNIRKWYAQLLLTAPQNIVPIVDVKDQVTISVADNGVVKASVPPECVRPVEWKLAGWEKSVTQFLSPNAPETAELHNEWTRPAAYNPAIIDHGNHLLLFSQPDGSDAVLELARCVVRPADGSYQFHRSALSTIPRWSEIAPFTL